MGERTARRARLAVALLGLGVAWAGGSCASEPASEPTPTQAAAPAPAAAFSGAAAFAHLEALTALGPRVSGTPGAEQARAYVRGQLEALGLDVKEIRGDYRPDEGEPVPLVNLVAEIPARGESPGATGVLALGAPLDTAPAEGFTLLGANEGASGAAVVLELARLLHAAPLAYPVRLLFFDGEHLSTKSPLLGSRIVAAEYASTGELDAIRLLVVLTQVGDRDLGIHRDLLSQRTYRDVFFDAAERMRKGAAFDHDGTFDQIEASQVSFFDVGLRRVVALADVRYGGDEPPGSFWRTADDDPAHCSAESLGTVGQVVLQGLRDVSARLLRVDALARLPVAPAKAAEPTTFSPETPAPAPEAATTEAPSGSGGDSVATPREAPKTPE